VIFLLLVTIERRFVGFPGLPGDHEAWTGSCTAGSWRARSG